MSRRGKSNISSGAPWTPAQLAAAREAYEDPDVDLRTFAQRMGRTPNALRLQAARYGWRRRKVPWTPEEDAFLRRWYPHDDGLAMSDLVRRLGRHQRQIERRAAALGLKRSLTRKADLLSMAAFAQHERAHARRLGETA